MFINEINNFILRGKVSKSSRSAWGKCQNRQEIPGESVKIINKCLVKVSKSSRSALFHARTLFNASLGIIRKLQCSTGIAENQFISKPMIIVFFPTHSFIVHTSLYVLFVIYTMLLKRRLVGRQMAALDALNDSTWQRHLAEKIVVLSAL